VTDFNGNPVDGVEVTLEKLDIAALEHDALGGFCPGLTGLVTVVSGSAGPGAFQQPYSFADTDLSPCPTAPVDDPCKVVILGTSTVTSPVTTALAIR